jgi:hypothetical protein
VSFLVFSTVLGGCGVLGESYSVSWAVVTGVGYDWPRDNSYTTRGIQPSKICIHIVTREYATPISF